MRNFWSLQVGEVVLGDKLMEYFTKNKLKDQYQLFFPLNSQLKDFDLLLFNKINKKTATLQIKESRTFGKGNDAWIVIDKSKVEGLVCDFYIFVIHTMVSGEHNPLIETKYLIVPADKLLEKSKSKNGYNTKAGKLQYHYYFKIEGDRAWEDRDKNKQQIGYSEFLDKFELLKI